MDTYVWKAIGHNIESLAWWSKSIIFKAQTATVRFYHFLLFIFLFTEEEWETELAAEIQDFEVVDDNVDDSELDDLK